MTKAIKAESFADAQPRHWQEWNSSSMGIESEIPAGQPDRLDWDGGTGSAPWQSQSWSEHPWHGGSSQDVYNWRAADARESWESWPAEESGETADLVDEAEKSLQTQVEELLGPAHGRIAKANQEQAVRVEKAKSMMGKRNATKVDNLVEALALLENGSLDKNHKTLQAATRNPKFAASDSNSSNKEYVKKFFEAELESIVVQYVAVEKYVEVNGIEAQFLSFDAIVEKEGGRWNPKNIEAARKRCMKCLAMGRSHARYDEWSERVNFAFIIDMFSAMKENSWAKETRGVEVAANGDGAASGSGGDPIGGGGGGGSGGGGSAGGGGGVPPPKKPVGHRKRTSLETNLAAATATKVAYKQIQGQGDELLLAMQTDAGYAREKQSYEAELTQAINHMLGAKKSNSFFNKFLLMDVADIRKEFLVQDTLSTHCTEMCDLMDPKIKTLEVFVKQVKAVVRARKAVTTPGVKKGKTKK